MAEDTNKSTRRTERIGKYEILDHLATGGMAVVYKARDMDLDRLVALKVLPAELAQQQTTLIRFQREARAAALLRHENIVTIYDVGEAAGTYYIALEYIDGTDLQDYITRRTKLEPEAARQIIVQAVHALAHAYEHGIVHRDIKPSNFLLTQKGDRLIVKLTDFGLAIQQENDAEFRITRDKTTVGTVDYMSPEQARDSRSADIRSDIYSLGCTFYHMLTGQAPFPRGTLPERIIQHMQTPPPDVRKLNRAVPSYMTAIVNRMLEKKPVDRYQTPAELLADLENPENALLADDGRASTRERRPLVKRQAESAPPPVDENVAIEEETERRPTKVKPRRPLAPPTLAKDEKPRTDIADRNGTLDTETSADNKSKKAAADSQVWMYAVAGTFGVLLLILVGAFLFSGRPGGKKDPEPEKKPPPVIIDYGDKKVEPPAIDTSPALMTVAAPVLPIMDVTPAKADLAALKADFYGPFDAFPEAPKDAAFLRVSRLGSANRSLVDAVAEAAHKKLTVIEINDNGPIFVPSLPMVDQRTILIRGGEGFRPLIVWDSPKKLLDAKTPSTFFALAQGALILDNLDIVARWSGEGPATLFDLPGSDFHARSCTFSVAGKSPQGIALLARRTTKDTPAADRETTTSLRGCYVRGPSLSLLRSQNTRSAVLLKDSLIVGYQQPLFDMRGRDEDRFSLHGVRSTLVAGQTLLHWQSEPGHATAPIHVRLLDSILTRDDTAAPVGDMVQLAKVENLRSTSWRAQNTIYAGWKQLLVSPAQTIGGGDLDGWHRQWNYSLGDRVDAGTWPANPPVGLEEQPASTFLPGQDPVAYVSLTGPGAIGCTIGRLPPAPTLWLERVYEPPPFAGIPPADFEVPQIDPAQDGLYHGERIDVTKVDAGAYLTGILQKNKPAPRVVIHLTGRGVWPTSTLRVKSVQNLVLYFEPLLTLEASTTAIKQRAPIIEMNGGHLEMIGARIQLSPVTLVPSIVQLHGASLTLTRSWLQGPLSRTADNFLGVVSAHNPGPMPTTLLFRDNVLSSGKLLLGLHDQVQLKARNNLMLSLGDLARFDFSGPPATMTHLLDHNTFAARQAFFTLKTGADVGPAGTVLVHGNSNAFLSPFGGEDAGKAILMRGADAWTARSRWAWQGRYNVYDARLHSYYAGFEKILGPRQFLRDWQPIWGQAGEFNAIPLEGAGFLKGVTVDATAPPLVVGQLDRLALPKALRGDPAQTPPGADLFSLGITRKKI